MTTKIDGTAGITFPDNTIRGSGSMVAGIYKKLALSATGLSALITVTADAVVLERTSDLSPILARSVNLTIDASTVGANGLDTGTLAASTWYAVHLESDGTNVRGLLSLSATAPTLTSGYTYSARIGWIRTDASGNKYPLSFMQKGQTVQYKVAAGSNVAALPVMDSGAKGNTVTPTWVAVPTANFIPSTAESIFITTANATASGVNIVAPNNSYGGSGSTTNAPPVNVGVATPNFSLTAPLLVESANIYWASGGATANLACLGWVDNI